MIKFLLQKDDHRLENKLEMIGWLKEDSGLAKSRLERSG